MLEGVSTDSDLDGDANAWVNGGYFPDQFYPIVRAILSVSMLVQCYKVWVEWVFYFYF